MQTLLRYAWPGNVRELKNAMDFVAATADGMSIDVWHLPQGSADRRRRRRR